MGRLIDANKFIEQIWQKHKEVEESYDLCVDELKEVFCGIVWHLWMNSLLHLMWTRLWSSLKKIKSIHLTVVSTREKQSRL